MSIRESLLALVGSPDRAWLALMAGMVLIGRELTGPGRILPGVLGGVCALTAMWALTAYRLNAGGVILLACGIGLIVLQGFRWWWFLPGAAGAAVSCVGARYLLVRPWAISWPAAASAAVVAALAGWLWHLAIRARRNKLSA